MEPRDWVKGTVLRLTVNNVFDRNPFASNGLASIGYVQGNGDLTNRFVNLGVFKRWQVLDQNELHPRTAPAE